MAQLQFSRVMSPPKDLHTSGVSKYDDLFKLILESKNGDWIKVDILEDSAPELNRSLHSASTSIRGWKSRINKSSEILIKMSLTSKRVTGISAQIYIHVQEIIRYKTDTKID